MKWKKSVTSLNLFSLQVIGLLLLTACGEKIQIDNPAAQDWVVHIDGDMHNIPAGQSQTLRLSQGNHTLVFKGSSVLDTQLTFQVQNETFIHPPGYKYLIWKDLYGSQKNRNVLLKENAFEMDSVIYQVDVRYLDTTKLIHPREWDFMPDEDFESSILLRQDQDEALRMRLLREKDFPEAYKKRSQK